MKRRAFLQNSGSAATMAAMGAPVFGLENKPLIQLGLVTYNWGKAWDLATLLKVCEVMEYAGVELRSTHAHKVEPDLSKTERADVKKRFADSPVELYGLGTACEYHSADPAVLKRNIEETKAFIHLAHDVGASGIKVRPNGLPKDVPVEKTLEQIGKSLDEVAAHGSEHGVEIRTEVHGRGTAEIAKFVEIMKHSQHENSTVCWNCNPADLEGEGLAKNWEALRKRVHEIHIHDLRNKDSYPWEEFFALLKKTKFSGWTLVEEGKVPDDVPKAMKEVRAEWERLTG
ncbi:MAG: TIM barrel protein [Verrucomicrobiales bacterium]|nr:TIM barrel protein [Verrucomicrobiales bacterium]